MTERGWAIGLVMLCGCIESRSPAADAPLDEQTPIACRVETDDGPLLIPSDAQFACGLLFRQMCGRGDDLEAHDRCYASHFEPRALLTPAEMCYRDRMTETVEGLSAWDTHWQADEGCAQVPPFTDVMHWPDRNTLHPCEPTNTLDFRIDRIEAADNDLHIHFEAFVCDPDQTFTTCFRQTSEGPIEIWPGYAWTPQACEGASQIQRVHTISGAFFEERAWFFTGRLPQKTDFQVLSRSDCATHLNPMSCERNGCEWTGEGCESAWQAARIVHR
jgi:hypothetical protein